MESADEIGSLPWQLRSAIDLATLWRRQSRSRDAAQMLRPVYDKFTEGFAAHDLTLAAQFLEQQ